MKAGGAPPATRFLRLVMAAELTPLNEGGGRAPRNAASSYPTFVVGCSAQ